MGGYDYLKSRSFLTSKKIVEIDLLYLNCYLSFLHWVSELESRTLVIKGRSGRSIYTVSIRGQTKEKRNSFFVNKFLFFTILFYYQS